VASFDNSGQKIQSTLSECWQMLGISPEAVERRGLPIFDEPAELVQVQVASDGRVHYLAPKAAEAWVAMKQAASDASIEMSLISGFRSVARQAELIQATLRQGQSIPEILTVLAPPGCSEHHTGRAVDIGARGFAGLDEAFENSQAFAWLEGNAQRFGFTLSFPRGNRWGYQYEPWHWCHQA
jgi:zinc D-Ala-D-Ala carboxypeptidase